MMRAVSSPIFLRIGVANFPIPVSSLMIHVAIDATCAQPGQTIPEDTQHVSLPLGSLENSRFELPRANIACAFRLPAATTLRWRDRAWCALSI